MRYENILEETLQELENCKDQITEYTSESVRAESFRFRIMNWVEMNLTQEQYDKAQEIEHSCFYPELGELKERSDLVAIAHDLLFREVTK